MPGMRTNLFMVFAVRSRNCSMLSPDRIVIWTFGMESVAVSVGGSEPPERGKRSVRAAFVAAFSNLSKTLEQCGIHRVAGNTHQW